MAHFEINGGNQLFGEVRIQGSKNAVLPMIAACVLVKEPVRIKGCPKIQDCYSMIKLLESIGCQVKWVGQDLIIDASAVHTPAVGEEYVKNIRSSVILLGPMLGRMGSVTIAYPGGCSIGKRPVDLHVRALSAMNVAVEETEQYLKCKTKGLVGNLIELAFPSVGATENVILAAVLAQGTTVLRNAAKEPEIVCLCDFLRSMGASIHDGQEGVIVIHGVKALHGTEFPVVCDRIVAGTYLACVAACGGEAFFQMDCGSQLDGVLSRLEEMGAEIIRFPEGIRLKSNHRLRAVDLIKTEPYPGFPTDMQSQFMAALAAARGTSIIIENIFEERFKTAEELVRMGADITVIQRAAVIKGVKELKGARVTAWDLRGGAALVIAGLMAQGTTSIQGIDFILRGYDRIDQCLLKLGADIKLTE